MASDNQTKNQFENGDRPVLLVGSVPLGSARAVFSMAGRELGRRLDYVPDGETGVRTHWVGWQHQAMLAAPFLEEGEVEVILGGAGRRPVFSVKGELPDDARFGPLGYAAVAKDSYAEFRKARDAGELAPRTRFQVSLPTPGAPMAVFIRPQDRARIEPVYARAMRDEVAAICAAIQHEDLVLQWDVATEFASLEGLQPGTPPSVEAVAADLAALGDLVPAGVGLGYHFCYGDAGHKHFKEPESTGLMVEVANALFARIGRTVDYIHLPVPRSRSDDAYFAPLKDLRLPGDCRLYLGLVHRTDGLAGAKERLAAATRVVSGFGVATECGWGRRPPDTVAEVMRLNAEVAAA